MALLLGLYFFPELPDARIRGNLKHLILTFELLDVLSQGAYLFVLIIQSLEEVPRDAHVLLSEGLVLGILGEIIDRDRRLVYVWALPHAGPTDFVLLPLHGWVGLRARPLLLLLLYHPWLALQLVKRIFDPLQLSR